MSPPQLPEFWTHNDKNNENARFDILMVLSYSFSLKQLSNLYKFYIWGQKGYISCHGVYLCEPATVVLLWGLWVVLVCQESRVSDQGSLWDWIQPGLPDSRLCSRLRALFIAPMSVFKHGCCWWDQGCGSLLLITLHTSPPNKKGSCFTLTHKQYLIATFCFLVIFPHN